MRLSQIPPKKWPGIRVAVYGNTQREKWAYLYDAVTLPRSHPGYTDKSTRVIVRPVTDSQWAQKAKVIDPNSCEILEVES